MKSFNMLSACARPNRHPLFFLFFAFVLSVFLFFVVVMHTLRVKGGEEWIQLPVDRLADQPEDQLSLVDRETSVNDVEMSQQELAPSAAAVPLLKILVLTYDRDKSLQRLLDSLDNAEYDGLPVSVEIHIDRSKDGKVHNQTMTVANNFYFKHGEVKVMVKPRHGGVLGQWLWSWKVPADNKSEIAVFLEDDLSVSPFFARWLRKVHNKYDDYPAINSYALQAETNLHATGVKGTLQAPKGESVFLYPVLGSWGFSPNTQWWKKFLRWYSEKSRDPKYIPFVRGLKPSSWYIEQRKRGRGESMWTMWHIAHAYENKLYTLYGCWPSGDGGVFNHKEAGEHYDAIRGNVKAKVMETWNEEDFLLPDDLVIVDARGKVMEHKMTPNTGLV